MHEDMPKLVADMLDGQWSLRPGDKPTIAYRDDRYMQDSRTGSLFVYQVGTNVRINTVDYRSQESTCSMAIRMACPDRERFLRHGEEVIRILMANRRAGPARLGGYEFLELVNISDMNDLSGYHTRTFDIRFQGYCFPIVSPGFGVDAFGRPIGPGLRPNVRVSPRGRKAPVQGFRVLLSPIGRILT